MKALQRAWLFTIPVVVALAFLVPQTLFADDGLGQQVTFTQVPAAVQATLKREISNGNINEIRKKTDDGKLVYEASLTINGKIYEAKIAENGVLLEKELKGGKEHYSMWSFEQDKVGSVPKGYKIAATNEKGKLATWQIVEDKSLPASTHVVAITQNENSGETYNLLILENHIYGDLELEVWLKAVDGKEDQGGGVIWRAKDEKNYYVCRWNPLEDNLRLYYVKDSKRKQLASVYIKADKTAWHKIEIEQDGVSIEVEFDGKKVIDIKDSTFTEPGMVGLWVKADSRSKFDNIKVDGVDLSAVLKAKSKKSDAQKANVLGMPSKVLDAANKAIPGGSIVSVEKDTDDGVAVYEIKKIVDGVEYEIEVTSDGVVKKVEKDND